jgi:hypothetical protein
MDHLDTDLIADTMPGYNATFCKGRPCMHTLT